MAMTVKPYEDPSTKAKRFVIGDRREVIGFLVQPQAKYVTGGFEVTAKELGFDKAIGHVTLGFDKEAKVIAVAERISDSVYKIKFFSAIGTELANESEAMSGKEVPFRAVGE
jgi:hypothetical protein